MQRRINAQRGTRPTTEPVRLFFDLSLSLTSLHIPCLPLLISAGLISGLVIDDRLMSRKGNKYLSPIYLRCNRNRNRNHLTLVLSSALSERCSRLVQQKSALQNRKARMVQHFRCTAQRREMQQIVGGGEEDKSECIS